MARSSARQAIDCKKMWAITPTAWDYTGAPAPEAPIENAASTANYGSDPGHYGLYIRQSDDIDPRRRVAEQAPTEPTSGY